MDLHRRLVVGCGREDFALARRDRGVRVDQAGEYAAERFDSQRQRGHVEQQHVFHFAGQHATLDGGADSDHFVRVDAFGRRFTEELFDHFLDRRDTGRTAYQDHFVDLTVAQSGVGHRFFARLDRRADQSVGQLFEFGARQGHYQVLRNPVHRHDVRQVDLGRGRARQFDLRLLGGLLQTLQGHRIFAQVDVMLFFELVGHPVDNHVVEVVASEVRVAVGRFHFEYAVAQFQNRNIERAASEVVYGDLHILVRLIQAVGQRCGRRFVDDTAHFQTGDFARFLGSLALRVGEVGRNSDDGFGYFGAEVILGGLFHFLQDDRGDFLRGIESAVDIDARGVVVAFDHFVSRPFNVFADLIVSLAHETLDRRDRTLWVGDRLPFGGVAHFPFVVVHERYDRRCRAASLAVGDHHGFVTLHHGNAGVRST